MTSSEVSNPSVMEQDQVVNRDENEGRKRRKTVTQELVSTLVVMVNRSGRWNLSEWILGEWNLSDSIFRTDGQQGLPNPI